MKKIITAALSILLATGNIANAEVRLPAIFGDNMVLQRDMKVPVYGWADAGETVQVTFMGKTYKTVTAPNGKWLLKLSAYKAGGPYTMQIAGKSNNINYRNILIGDVWLCSGQSNMEFGIQRETNAAAAIKATTDKEIHFFFVPMTFSLQPQDEMLKTTADSPNGKWMVASPELMADPQYASHGFSAIGLYFAQQIRKATGLPLGMIAGYRGGTPVEAWISPDGLEQNPALAKYAKYHQRLVSNYETAKTSYPAKLKAYNDSLKVWNQEVGKTYQPILAKWQAAVKEVLPNGQNIPARPAPSRPAPVEPVDPQGGFRVPAACYNGIIAPLVGYGIKGVLWYQGEGNGGTLSDALDYETLFPRMITDWRSKWGQGNFPFLYVQLPNFHAEPATPSSGNWTWVRDGQQKTLALPNTGMAVITDAGGAGELHPPDKSAPAGRLVMIARNQVYAQKNVVYSGPAYKSMQVVGNKIVLTFDHVHKGLTAGRPSRPGEMTTMEIKELKGFGIAGADQKFVWAKAVIKGNTIEVSAEGLNAPVAVRYNWNDNPPGNLYNHDGLPAAPFRTDNWAPGL